MTSPEARARGRALFDEIAETHLRLAGIDVGPMFGTDGLRVRGKVYAFVAATGALVAKVPRTRADDLVADGTAERMSMRERLMKEWVTVPVEAGAPVWSMLMDEARAYVDEVTPR